MGNFQSLKFPLTKRGMDFFGSKNKENIAKAYVAYSPNLIQANDLLRRRGYTLQMRKRIMKTYKAYVNNPEMTSVPFSDLDYTGAGWLEDLDYLEEGDTLEKIIYG